ncbi:MAG: hypothetical protein LBI71_02310 [Enterobacteriaceae bacterium]|jgi:diadenosine tetraphosphate (Ap4A) HIT family hydrolase|nr:hypothetical protein [Enterobacteriaceae bacterium]
MEIPNEKIILKTTHWVINHRVDSSLSGYVMMQSCNGCLSLSDLPTEAIQEMGIFMSSIESTLKSRLSPIHLYIGKYGHTPNMPFHFHFIPVSQWLLDLFWRDERYRILSEFSKPSLAHLTDGAELTFFIWREFCEKEQTPPIQGLSVDEVISMLRIELRRNDPINFK